MSTATTAPERLDHLDHLDAQTILSRTGALLAGQRVERVELVAGRPRRRATYAVEVSGPRATLFLKCFSDARRADLAATALASLGAAFGPASPYRVVELLGRDATAVVCRPATGQRLDELVMGGSPVRAGSLAAGWLARLHGCRARLARRLDHEQEARTVAEWVGPLSRATDGLDGVLATLGTMSVERAHGPADALVPIHKDLHHGHLYVAPDGGVTAIDLDEARLGPAAFDVAHVVVNLEVLALLSGSDLPLAAARSFLDAYRAATGGGEDADHTRWRAYCLLKLAWQALQQVGPPPLAQPPHRGDARVVARILALDPAGGVR